MKLSITAIKDAGLLEKERIVLNVAEDGYVGNYVIVGSYKSDDSMFWFDTGVWLPSIHVKKGDTIVIYTKIGESKTKEIMLNKSYFYYLGKAESFWEKGRVLLLMELSDADSYSVSWDQIATTEADSEGT